MNKLNMQTTNIVDENIKRIGELFPNCLTERLNEEGKPEMAIDFDQLRQELSKDIVEGSEERYQFTWPDKRNAIRLANAPTTDTLRPCREESVNFDTTQNLYIEGDNLQVLKLLRENYLGKAKMIYIDPPYNTGNDFVYNDDFAQTASEYIHNSGQEDEEGNRLVANTESNGRFHTDWLNMIYPRLKVAKDLLSEDGVFFISVDDNEVENLKKVCDEVCGEKNFVANIVWEKMYTTKNDAANISNSHEYLICYAKNILCFKMGFLERTQEMNERYTNPDNDSRGPWKAIPLYARGESKNGRFPIVAPMTKVEHFPPVDSHWRYNKETIYNMLSDNRIWFGKNGDAFPNSKRFLSEMDDGVKAKSLWLHSEVGSNDTANKEMRSLFPEATLFDFPKPSSLIMRAIKLGTYRNSIVMDFFSGSATTAHAVMQLNADDGGNRKFIMVQLPEATDEKSEAYKAGYKNICEIGKERIRRAGKKIEHELELKVQSLKREIDLMLSAKPDRLASMLLLDQLQEIAENIYKEKILPKQKELNEIERKISNLDIGFRVLKLDSSNMTDVYYTPEEFNEQMLFENNIKGDRTEEDLLFQAMIELGIELSAKIERTEIAGKTVWNVADNYLLACFDEEVNETTITEIAKQQPYYFVMRDSSLANDQVADNFEQIFEHYSKDTIRKII